MRAVALAGCFLLAVFVPQPPEITDTDVPPATLVAASAPDVPEAVPAAADGADDALPAPPMMADGIPIDDPPAVPVRVVHGCDADAERLCTQDTLPRPEWRWCEQWHDMAEAVGWPESQGPTLSYVMHRESGCKPSAHNPSGATGLMQLLGWSCPPNGCFDPWSNLAKALNLWETQGWCPWVLRGDPVTGRACG